jgi:uncharacterized membrane protein
MSDPDLERLEHQIGRVLRAGVVLSATILAAGLVMALSGVTHAARVLDAGVILLVAIPVARIAMSFVDAIRRRDRLLAYSTAAVLLVLAALFVYARG